jgi:hypothetical protein
MKRNPIEFVWAEGRPVFDLVSAILRNASGKNLPDNIDAILKTRIDDCGIDDLIRQRDSVKNQNDELAERIDGWKQQLEEIELKISKHSDDVLGLLLDENSSLEQFEHDYRLNIERHDLLKMRIQAANVAILRNKKNISDLSQEIKTQFNRIESEVRQPIQADIDSQIKAVVEKVNAYQGAVIDAMYQLGISNYSHSKYLGVYGIPPQIFHPIDYRKLK